MRAICGYFVAECWGSKQEGTLMNSRAEADDFVHICMIYLSVIYTYLHKNVIIFASIIIYLFIYLFFCSVGIQ